MAEIIYSNHRLVVSGDLDFASVPHLWQQSLVLCATLSELHFDLENVRHSNSAGLALLLEWLKYANKFQKKIAFIHIPSQLCVILQAAGIRDLIPT